MSPPPAEFQTLALAQIDLLYRLALRLTRDPHRAEDIVQETYYRAFRAREKFKLESFGIRPWLIRILRNVAINAGEREGRQPVLRQADELTNAGPMTPADLLPLSPGSWEGVDDRLMHALEEIPADYSSVLLLWAVDEMSYKEIAEALEIPIGTVMSRLHRARAKLAEALAGLAQERRLTNRS